MEEKLAVIKAGLDQIRDNARLYSGIQMTEVKIPKWYTKVEALELALEHVRDYNDRMFIQFLIEVEKRK